MLAAVVISFFVCLLPFRGLTLWIIIAPAEDIIALGIEKYYNILYFSRIMLYLNSAMNPILYNLMSSKFREGFFRLLGCRSFVVRKKFIYGTHKGTFHTTSTNLSSSQSNDRRVHHHHQHGHGSSVYNGGGNGSFSSFSNRKRMSDTFDDSCVMPSEYLIEGNGKLVGNGRKKSNFIIKKCLVESTVINAIAHEPAANKDLSRKLKENFTEPSCDFTSEIESLMDDGSEYGGVGVEEEVVVSRRNSRNLMRRPSRHLEFNNNCRENGNGDVIVVLIKPVTTSPIHEESNSLDGNETDPVSTVENEADREVEVDEQSVVQHEDECDEDGQETRKEVEPLPAEEPLLSGNVNGGKFDFTEAVFLAAKESVV